MSKDRPEFISTRIISQRELVIDGAPFQWWAVGEHPSLVTVRSAVFGSMTKFSDGDVAQVAASLAKELLAQHYARAGRSPTGKALKLESTGLSKPGWFEPGDAVDFSTTVF
ncbi:MAG TPA: hypothetical protein VGL98_00635 [Gammaproteobacteria bacterium]